VRELAQPAGRVVVIEAGPTHGVLSQVVLSVLADRAGLAPGGYLAGTPHQAKESLRTPYVRVLLVKVALANVLLALATGVPPSVGSLL
jgi:hypothetical protein